MKKKCENDFVLESFKNKMTFMISPFPNTSLCVGAKKINYYSFHVCRCFVPFGDLYN